MFDFFVQTSGGCPPVVCLSMSSGSDWRWNICCGSLMASQLDSGRSVYTQGSPPKKPNSSPTQGLPWPLLARAFYLWPLGGQKVQEERTPSPTLCVCCTFPHDGMWGWQSWGPRGSREHPCLCLDAQPDRESVWQEGKGAKWGGEKEAQGEKSVILMGTFMALGEFGWQPDWPVTNHSPADTSQMYDCELYCPKVKNDRCIFLWSFTLQQAGFKEMLVGQVE